MGSAHGTSARWSDPGGDPVSGHQVSSQEEGAVESATSHQRGAVVVCVGVDGQLSEGTIDFAVSAATRLESPIEILHVVPAVMAFPTDGMSALLTQAILTRDGQRLLASAAAALRARGSADLVIAERLLTGRVVSRIVDRSREASLVWSESTHPDGLERLVSGSVSSGVSARAHCPVVCVPRGWSAQEGARLPITVGVEEAERAEAEVWAAVGIAVAEDLPVRMVRAVNLPEAYQDILRGEHRDAAYLDTVRADLVSDCAFIEETRDQVSCDFEAHWGKPADVLVELSASSSVVVLARRDPLLPIGTHLGPTVRHVLRHATCPVLIVEPRQDRA